MRVGPFVSVVISNVPYLSHDMLFHPWANVGSFSSVFPPSPLGGRGFSFLRFGLLSFSFFLIFFIFFIFFFFFFFFMFLLLFSLFFLSFFFSFFSFFLFVVKEKRRKEKRRTRKRKRRQTLLFSSFPFFSLLFSSVLSFF